MQKKCIRFHLSDSHPHTSERASRKKNRIENGNLLTTRNSPVVLDAVYLNVFPVRTYFSHTRCCSRDQAKYNFISFVIGIVIFTLPPAYFLLTLRNLANAHAYNHIHTQTIARTPEHIKWFLLDSYCFVCAVQGSIYL